MYKLTLNVHVALWAWFSTRHCISGMKELQNNYWAGANEHAGNDEIQYFKV